MVGGGPSGPRAADPAARRRGRARPAPPRPRGAPPARCRPGADGGRRDLGRGEGHHVHARGGLGRRRGTRTASWPGSGWGRWRCVRGAGVSALRAKLPVEPPAAARVGNRSHQERRTGAGAAPVAAARAGAAVQAVLAVRAGAGGPGRTRGSAPVTRVASCRQPADRPRLLLLDGHSLAYRAFFALPGGELLDHDRAAHQRRLRLHLDADQRAARRGADPRRGRLRQVAPDLPPRASTPSTRPSATRRPTSSGASCR